MQRNSTLHAEPFTDEQNPASNINDLTNYLSRADDGNYVYRGQTRKYSGPLLPSAFRGVLGREPAIEEGHPFQAHRVRGVGRRFLGNYVLDLEEHHQKVADAILQDVSPERFRPAKKRDANAYLASHFRRLGEKWVEKLSVDPLDFVVQPSFMTGEFNSLAATRGSKAAARAIIERYCPPVATNSTSLQQAMSYLDDRHRYWFATEILVTAFGYVMGSLISQQYGFRSALLDASTSIEIAAFFATHEAPNYELVAHNPEGLLGVIY